MPTARFFQVSPISLFALLAYAVPVPMLFALAWFTAVGFRFATGCWEGYHFWIPVVEYIWYMQYTIFPL